MLTVCLALFYMLNITFRLREGEKGARGGSQWIRIPWNRNYRHFQLLRVETELWFLEEEQVLLTPKPCPQPFVWLLFLFV